jgi:SAM-dependent methyltransferase
MKETNNWHLKLFKKSVLKQAKLREILSLLGPTEGKRCLDIGGDNGLISYYLRKRGGEWASADLEEEAVNSIRNLVKTEVYKIDGRKTPFEDNTFDVVVIIDFLEHIPTDKIFIEELKRIMKNDSTLIINVPYLKKFSLLRVLKNGLGLTDERHGHLRPGYSLEQLREMLKGKFEISKEKTYSRFFSELLDTLLTFAYINLSRSRIPAKGGSASGMTSTTRKGTLITEKEFSQNKKILRIYSIIYPFFWLISKLDYLIFFLKGHSLILKARKTT